MNKKILLSIMIITSMFIPVAAEQNSVQTITLNQAVETALKNSPVIKTAEQKLRDAKGQEISAFSGFVPGFAVTGSYLSLNEPITTMGYVVSPKDSYSYGYTVTQNLFTSGKLISGYNISRANMRAAVEEYRKAKNDVTFDTTKTFYGLLLAQKMAELMQESYDQMVKHVEQVKAYYDNGIVSKFDLLRTQVQLSNLKPQLLRVKNGVKLAEDGFNMTIGSPLGTHYKLEGEIRFEEISAADTNELIETAMENKPELKMLKERENMARKGLNLAIESNGPNVIGMYNWKKAKPFQLPTYAWEDDWGEPDWNVMLTLQWPLSFGSYGKIKSAKAQLEQVGLCYKQLKDATIFEVKQICMTLEQEKQNIESQNENIAQAQEALQIAEERYKQGIISNLEYMDTQLALTQAKTNYFQAITNYEIAKAQLVKAVGK